LKIEEHISLKEFNSFGIDVKASQYIKITEDQSLVDLLKSKEYSNPFILSGGSNLLLTKDLNRLVIHMCTKGIEIYDETSDEIIIKVKAGEIWHDFVQWCVDKNYAGLENLSLIPGFVGSAPIQNIGAYGVEQQDCFYACEVLDRTTITKTRLTKKDCEFGYRESIFKSKAKDRYIITAVYYQLKKTNHQLKTSYGAIEEQLTLKEISHPTIKDVANAVIAIRSEKLPDPKKIGNSGSFFKNPIISKASIEQLKKKYPLIPTYVVNENYVKVAAGWLIEQAGYKGKTKGNVGTHHKQALVLINHGNATGKELVDFSEEIITAIQTQFNITLEAEVRII